MSAPEQPQGVLLRYAGGTVYAAPEEAHGFLALRVAGVRVAVTPMEPCPVWPVIGGFDTSGFETGGTLTDLVAAGEHHRRVAHEALRRRRRARDGAHAEATGEGEAHGQGEGEGEAMSTEHTVGLARAEGLTVDAQTWPPKGATT